ncbi:MAG: HD domain-containing protein [Caldilineales bacterium]|nr:HD domain-containing protein [Caldilineales bacterium]MDW8318473.1 HD domain-containing protein [Anaerolineae bacterium]
MILEHLDQVFPPASVTGQLLAFLRRWPPPVHLVGGCVRDLLLGRPTKDLDVVVPTGALRLARAAADALGGAYVPLDVERDTARALFADEAGPVQLDVAGWRGATLADDLRARDFTVNALAWELGSPDPRLMDVTGGLDDLAQRLIRLTAERALLDDPLRGLRGVRLAAELAPWGFRLEGETAQALRRHAPLLGQPSAERVRDELVRILSAESPDCWLRLMDGLGQLSVVLPEVAALHGVEQPPPHRWDVFEHTLAVVAHAAWQLRWLDGKAEPRTAQEAALAEALAARRADLRSHFSRRDGQVRTRGQMWLWAALAHDWGKPAARSVETSSAGAERVRFLGHEQVGAALVEEALRRLRFNDVEVRRAKLIVAQHMRPLSLAEAGTLARRAVYRFFRATRDAGVDVALLSLADLAGTYGPDLPEAIWRRQLEVVGGLVDAYFSREAALVHPEPLVRGADVMDALGIPSGPLVGRLLDEIAEAQAAGEVTTRQEALALAARLTAERQPEA